MSRSQSGGGFGQTGIDNPAGPAPYVDLPKKSDKMSRLGEPAGRESNK